MLLDDLLDIAWMDIAIPDGFWIDHYNRTMLALVQAAGFIGADPMLESGILQCVFED